MASYHCKVFDVYAHRAAFDGNSFTVQRRMGEGAWQAQLNAAPRVHAMAVLDGLRQGHWG
ncbi:hypothetical protein GCM10027256_25620 [Novispirillum itersonii subsp. nipponicum]